MARVVTIPLQANTTRELIIDRDTTLVSGMSTLSGAAACVVSQDPSFTGARIVAIPAATEGNTGDILLILVAASAAFAQDLQIPLTKDSRIYLNSSAGCWVFLRFFDNFSAEFPVT